jgi:hypothetical protein
LRSALLDAAPPLRESQTPVEEQAGAWPTRPRTISPRASPCCRVSPNPNRITARAQDKYKRKKAKKLHAFPCCRVSPNPNRITARAQDKYKRKKAKKYLARVTAVRPSGRALAETHFDRRGAPGRTGGLRADALALLLALGNVAAGGRVLLADGCGGLLAGARLSTCLSLYYHKGSGTADTRVPRRASGAAQQARSHKDIENERISRARLRMRHCICVPRRGRGAAGRARRGGVPARGRQAAAARRHGAVQPARRGRGGRHCRADDAAGGGRGRGRSGRQAGAHNRVRTTYLPCPIQRLPLSYHKLPGAAFSSWASRAVRRACDLAQQLQQQALCALSCSVSFQHFPLCCCGVLAARCPAFKRSSLDCCPEQHTPWNWGIEKIAASTGVLGDR